MTERAEEPRGQDLQTRDARDYAKGSPEDRSSDAPSGKEGLTEGDKTLPPDQAAFQPESS